MSGMFFPGAWELCLASPKKQLNKFPFPLISVFCRLQTPWLHPWEAGEGDGLLGTLGAVLCSETRPSVKLFPLLEALPMLEEQGHSFNFGIS